MVYLCRLEESYFWFLFALIQEFFSQLLQNMSIFFYYTNMSPFGVRYLYVLLQSFTFGASDVIYLYY